MADKKLDWLRPAAIGPHFLICTVIGYYFGSKLDGWLQTYPLWTALLTVLGIIAGFLNLFRELKLINEAEQEEIGSGQKEEGISAGTSDEDRSEGKNNQRDENGHDAKD